MHSDHRHPILDSTLPFHDYIYQCRRLIEERRHILASTIDYPSQKSPIGIPIETVNPQVIIDANSPYELYPENPILSGKKLRYGVLLIHGLLDCPFTFRDIGNHLQQHGILSRSILLPGHGTSPDDLMNVSYHDWIQAVQYGIDSLQPDVDHIVLAGFSTGATLAIYHAIRNANIKGLILLAPAIRIKPPVDTLLNWHGLLNWLTRNNRWFYRENETDYAKYQSITYNAVLQVAKLANELKNINETHLLHCPMLMAMSKEDETVCSQDAIAFFSRHSHPRSQFLLYTPKEIDLADKRIVICNSAYPKLRIKNYSHVALPFSPANAHYGQHGDYLHASHIDAENNYYGAYNHLYTLLNDRLFKFGLTKKRYQELTYNPSFSQMANNIVDFIKKF